MNHKQTILKVVIFFGVIATAVWFSKTDFFMLKQREFNQILMGSIRELKEAASIQTLIMISLFSVLYGVIHALGPGHGKLVISNFLLGNSSNFKNAMKASFFTTLTHVGVAVIIAFLFKYVFTGIKHFQRISVLGNFKTVSAIIIGLIGLLIIVYPLIKKWIPVKDRPFRDNALMTGILAGAVPCPLSMTIMLITISYSIEYIGLILVASIAFGILFFLIFFSFTFVYFKENFARLFNSCQFKLPVDFRYIQGLLYIVIGFLLF